MLVSYIAPKTSRFSTLTSIPNIFLQLIPAESPAAGLALGHAQDDPEDADLQRPPVCRVNHGYERREAAALQQEVQAVQAAAAAAQRAQHEEPEEAGGQEEEQADDEESEEVPEDQDRSEELVDDVESEDIVILRPEEEAPKVSRKRAD